MKAPTKEILDEEMEQILLEAEQDECLHEIFAVYQKGDGGLLYCYECNKIKESYNGANSN